MPARHAKKAKKTFAKPTKPKARKRKVASKKRPGVAALRSILRADAPRLARPRSDLAHVGPVAVAREAAPSIAAAAAGGLTFVAVVSHDGPWELRSLVINSFQVLDKTQPSTERRIDVPIPPEFGGELAIAWSILAGHPIPTVATFVEPAGQEPVLLAKKNALKKGESWTPLDTVSFPPDA